MKTLTKIFLSRLFTRGIIAALFIFVIALFLYMPLFVEKISTGKTLNVCIFAETFTPESIALFEKQTGIKVNVTYVETDNQIYARFRINQGEGYDVVNISDYLVALLRKQGFLRKIDRSKISNFGQLDKRLMHLPFDPDSDFCLPHKWYVYGIVYDTRFFPVAPDKMSFDYIFRDPKQLCAEHKVSAPYKLCMLEDHLDVTYLTAIYLGKNPYNITQQDLEEIQNLLIKQKSWVEVYSVHSILYFLFSGVVPIALTSSNYVSKIFSERSHYDFAIPREGSLFIVENLAIPRLSKKADLAHKFIDFMLSEEIATLNSVSYGFNSSHVKAINAVDPMYRDNRHITPDNKMFSKLYVPGALTDLRKATEEMWLSIGLA